MNVFRGMSPRTLPRLRLTGVLLSLSSCTTKRPSPVTSPSNSHVTFSLSHMFLKSSIRSGVMRTPHRSWYSAIHILSTGRVGSPSLIRRSSILPPDFSDNTSRVRRAARPLVVDARGRLLITHFNAGPDDAVHFLLHLRVAALHRVKSDSASFSPWSLLEAEPPRQRRFHRRDRLYLYDQHPFLGFILLRRACH